MRDPMLGAEGKWKGVGRRCKPNLLVLVVVHSLLLMMVHSCSLLLLFLMVVHNILLLMMVEHNMLLLYGGAEIYDFARQPRNGAPAPP